MPCDYEAEIGAKQLQAKTTGAPPEVGKVSQVSPGALACQHAVFKFSASRIVRQCISVVLSSGFVVLC